MRLRSSRTASRTAASVLLAAALLAAAGCSELISSSRPERGSSAPEEPLPPAQGGAGAPPARNDASGPSAALLAQSRAQRAAGSYTQAESSVERALQIDPNNAALWVELGEIDLATGRTAQAATMARKALTLAPRDSQAAADASSLLERARR